MERQIESMKLYLTAQGKTFGRISDIGFGINYKKARKIVEELIEDGGEKDNKNNSSNADSK